MHALANFSFAWLGGFSVLCNLAGKQSISKKLSNKEKKKPNGYQQEQKTITILHHQLLTPIINTKNIIGYISKEIK